MKCEWCGEETNLRDMEEAGGCDIIPKGFMCCVDCINLPKQEDATNEEEEMTITFETIEDAEKECQIQNTIEGRNAYVVKHDNKEEYFVRVYS